MNKRNLTLVLDCAHGKDIAGKQSPDHTHQEWKWSRDILYKLSDELKKQGFEVYFTNDTDEEIGLTKRVEVCNNLPGKHKLLFSLHNNAAGDGSKWRDATGYEIYTSVGQTRSDLMADIIMTHLKSTFKYLTSMKARVDLSDGDMDKEKNFTVLMNKDSAVLLEWLFMDNKRDLQMLKDPIINEQFRNALIAAFLEIDYKLGIDALK